MLVPGKQDIKIELLTDAVGDIFVGGGKHPAGGKIPLEPTVIDAEVEVGFAAELFQCRGGCWNGIGDGDAGKMLRPFPNVHIVGDDADDTDAQTVFQRMDASRKAHPGAVPADILTDAAGSQGVQVAFQVGHAVVKIVVAQCDIIVAAAVHHLGKGGGILQGIVAEGPQRGALQQVAAINDESVAIAGETAGALEQADVTLLPAAVIGGVDIGVKIGSEKDGEFFTFHSYPRASRTRILAEMASMMSTRMISPSRMAPTSFQR